MENLQIKESAPAAKKTFMDRVKVVGPGAIITASFIGPGTVTTATRAGASFGYALLWAVLFSIITTIILQEMAARLGIIGQKGLGEAIRDQFTNPILKFGTMWFVMISIGVGCAAYISGDLTGTSIGLSTLTGWPVKVIGPAVGLIILFFGLKGSYKLIEKVMIFLVVVMSLTFIVTMIVAMPNVGGILKGAFIPAIPDGSVLLIIALIGTTVVPYNFFIHASTVQERWNKPEYLRESRWDIYVSIGVGGLITAAILITSATVIRGLDVQNVADLSLQLEPLLGTWAKAFTAIGIFAAGLSSAAATPLGAALTISSVMKWENGMKNPKYKLVFASTVIIGIIALLFDFEPMDVILFAQALNGILLPGVAILLLFIMNNKKLLGEYANTLKTNILGIIVVLVCTFLGLYSFVGAIRTFLGM
ncbi:Nramp family divalent metal transporter [Siminovitchia sp. 179-K 8D1 HS]|uniref:Nramp family divalent metal transporter n=1 Tax=Siminovitchia sp. 179-K 8D1 HS TaxID=3142385 RepID=UPI0039A2C0E7